MRHRTIHCIVAILCFLSPALAADDLPAIELNLYLPSLSWTSGLAFPVVAEIRNAGSTHLSLRGWADTRTGLAKRSESDRLWVRDAEEWTLTFWYEPSDRFARGQRVFRGALIQLPTVTLSPGEAQLVKMWLKPGTLTDGNNVVQCTLRQGTERPVYSERVTVYCGPDPEPGDQAVK